MDTTTWALSSRSRLLLLPALRYLGKQKANRHRAGWLPVRLARRLVRALPTSPATTVVAALSRDRSCEAGGEQSRQPTLLAALLYTVCQDPRDGRSKEIATLSIAPSAPSREEYTCRQDSDDRDARRRDEPPVRPIIVRRAGL